MDYTFYWCYINTAHVSCTTYSIDYTGKVIFVCYEKQHTYIAQHKRALTFNITVLRVVGASIMSRYVHYFECSVPPACKYLYFYKFFCRRCIIKCTRSYRKG